MRFLFTTAIALPLSFGILPLVSLPLQFLENRIPHGEIDPKHIDGIIVLRGCTGNGVVAEIQGQYGLNVSAERFTAAMMLARQLQRTPILFSGFSGELIQRGWHESDKIRDLIHHLGGLNITILFEENSRNTYENVGKSQHVFTAEHGTNWIRITSANHLPRVVGSFAAMVWTGMIPFPGNYQTTKAGHTISWSMGGGILRQRQSLHECAILLIYYLTGCSTNLLPN